MSGLLGFVDLLEATIEIVLRQNEGPDSIVGGPGDNVLFGGAGADTILGDTETGPPPPPSGTPGNNLILAGSGDDVVIAGYGADTVFGGSGDDSINGLGSARFFPPSATESFQFNDGADLLFGGSGADTIDAGGGEDTVRGGDGDDRILGSFGADLMYGEQGEDVFAFIRGSGRTGFRTDSGVGEGERDVIQDFQQGEDLLDLTGYRNPLPVGPQPEPIFLGTDDFLAEQRLQVRYEHQDGDTVVQVYGPVGTGPEPPEVPAPTMEFELAGLFELTAEDFIL